MYLGFLLHYFAAPRIDSCKSNDLQTAVFGSHGAGAPGTTENETIGANRMLCKPINAIAADLVHMGFVAGEWEEMATRPVPLPWLEA